MFIFQLPTIYYFSGDMLVLEGGVRTCFRTKSCMVYERSLSKSCWVSSNFPNGWRMYGAPNAKPLSPCRKINSLKTVIDYLQKMKTFMIFPYKLSKLPANYDVTWSEGKHWSLHVQQRHCQAQVL